MEYRDTCPFSVFIMKNCSCQFFQSEPCDDPYVMEEVDPAQCHALESSLWEINVRLNPRIFILLFIWSCPSWHWHSDCLTINKHDKELTSEYLKGYWWQKANLFLDFAEALPPRCGQGCHEDQRATDWTRGRYQWDARALVIWGN